MKKNKNDIDKINVTLKPVFGINPETYMTVIFFAVCLVVFFMLFFYPGITNNGARVRFESTPDNAAVFINGEYKGTTGTTFFVPSGRKTITITKNGVQPRTLTKNIPGSVFASLFFPARLTIEVELQADTVRDLLSSRFTEFEQWALSDGSDASFNSFLFSNKYVPYIINNTVRFFFKKADSQNLSVLGDFLEQVSFFSTSPRLAGEAINSWFMYKSGGEALTPAGTLGALREFVTRFNQNKGLSFYMYRILNNTSLKKEFHRQTWFSNLVKKYVTNEYKNHIPVQRPDTRPLLFKSHRFVEIKGGMLYRGAYEEKPNPLDSLFLPSLIAINGFEIMDREVTNEQYRRFLADVPAWSLENKQQLIQKGLVSDRYLNHFKTENNWEGIKKYPVTYISKYAASAYCKWLTEEFSKTGRDITVRLPTEEEWEWTARTTKEPVIPTHRTSRSQYSPLPAERDEPGYTGIYGLMGNVWEWCEDPYLPAEYLYSSLEQPMEAINATPFATSQSVVKGGSWANAPENVNCSSRGSQPDSFCTAFAGFRLVIEGQ